MEPRVAVEILKRAVESAVGNKRDHQIYEQAVLCLEEFFKPKAAPEGE